MARYIPQSKINILQTTGTEFVVESTNRAYQGSYIEYSDGSFFAGSNPENPGERLIRKKNINNSFGISNNNRKYRNLKKTIYNNLSKVIPIPPSKPIPTNNDYKNGYFTRYFCKRTNEKINYFEIDKNTYISIFNKDPKYDYNLYVVGELKWTIIKPNSTSVETINKNTLDLISVDFPLIELLFSNLNEHEAPYTEGGEFTIGKTRKNYIGYYHFHPEFGYAMEGAFHVPTKHRRLFKVRKRAKEEISDREISRSVSQTPRVTTPTRIEPTPVTPTSTPSVAPSRPSSGGGGGY